MAMLPATTTGNREGWFLRASSFSSCCFLPDSDLCEEFVPEHAIEIAKMMRSEDSFNAWLFIFYAFN